MDSGQKMQCLGKRNDEMVAVPLNVCVFTGTRAEYGLLRPVISLFSSSDKVNMRLVVSGSHLSNSYGNTETQILADGYQNYERAEILLDSSSDTSVCTAMALGILRYGDILSRIRPDIVVLLGDRYEALAFACSASICRIPIAHIHGGELTIGAIDDAFRHAITKMSHLHFAATEQYRRRIIQMGERNDRVFNVGSLGVDNIRSLGRLSRSEVEARLGLKNGKPYFLVTYHPVTLLSESPVERVSQLLTILTDYPDHVVVVTGSNADEGGAIINTMLENQASLYPDRIKFRVSLGTELYLSTARYADIVIGNSSSGIIEVPSLGVPVIDIAPRQLGRERSEAVISCDDTPRSIRQALDIAMKAEFRKKCSLALNPYDREGTAEAIVDKIVEFCGKLDLKKGFMDIKY